MKAVLRIDIHWGDLYLPDERYQGYLRLGYNVDIPLPLQASDRDGYEVVE